MARGYKEEFCKNSGTKIEVVLVCRTKREAEANKGRLIRCWLVVKIG